LIQFALALQAGRLLTPTSVDLLTTGKESMEPGGPKVVAYGFLERRVNGVRVIENSLCVVICVSADDRYPMHL
jgi:hypothetical protein